MTFKVALSTTPSYLSYDSSPSPSTLHLPITSHTTSHIHTQCLYRIFTPLFFSYPFIKSPHFPSLLSPFPPYALPLFQALFHLPNSSPCTCMISSPPHPPFSDLLWGYRLGFWGKWSWMWELELIRFQRFYKQGFLVPFPCISVCACVCVTKIIISVKVKCCTWER